MPEKRLAKAREAYRDGVQHEHHWVDVSTVGDEYPRVMCVVCGADGGNMAVPQ